MKQSDDNIDDEDFLGPGEEFPPELEDAIMEYFNITESDILSGTIQAQLQELILYGESIAWYNTWMERASQDSWKDISGRELQFMEHLYNWIISFSDSLRFTKLNENERIIVAYIKK